MPHYKEVKGVAKSIRMVLPSIPQMPKKKQVAAYARVSSGKDAMLHSLSAQVSHYSALIQRNPEWSYAGVYADEACTGTKDNRDGFQSLLADCRAGKIDIVLTKSISRFARNTVTLLDTIRELKALGIDVFFEEQNIHSMSGDGELLLTILASYAQEESLSVSENCKWRIRNKFKDGIPTTTVMNGYHISHGKITVIPHEAEVVRMIFHDYIGGMGRDAISRKLNRLGIPAKHGGIWYEAGIQAVLQNEKYVGDLLLQKYYCENHLTKKMKRNRGELDQYYIPDNHEPIIDKATFDRVQELIKERAAKYHPQAYQPTAYPFSGMIVCGNCGLHYIHKTAHGIVYWNCSTTQRRGADICQTQKIPEDILKDITASVLGLEQFDETVFKTRIATIRVPAFNRLVFVFKDGSEVERTWQYRSRRESWTDEMRKQAAEHAKRRKRI